MVALYRKVLKLSPKGLQAESTGKIVTLMSNDVNKLQDLFSLIHNVWAARRFLSSLLFTPYTTSSNGPRLSGLRAF